MSECRKTCQKYSGIGGQAIIEGIMMRAGDKYSIAVRKPDGEIAVEVKEFKSICPWKKAHQIPLLRGAIAFVDSLVTGVTSLTRSADLAVEEEEEDNGKEKTAEDLKRAGSDPASIFRSFCMDVIGTEPDDEQIKLFMEAYEEEEEELQ